jgi:acyl carrier protein
MTDSLRRHGPAEIGSWLRERVAFYLDQPEETIDTDTPLTDYGMNSIYAASVLADVEDEFGVEFETIPAWSQPTIGQISQYLADMLAGLVGTG